MTDHTHGGHGHGEHGHGGDHGHGDLFRTYMAIAVVLAICTALSFVFNYFAYPPGKGSISVNTAFFLILIVAIVKASLVTVYFMHLKWDWSKLYFIIVPVSILGVMMAVVFLPDTLIGPSKDAAEQYEIAQEAAPK
ncbi:MAG: cytochrome C oxidase subunit IV family protein [Gemmataceae bacterium]|nr:cytochrome C oxidase subunit IV family protein [Gemmataceae bacterium]